MLRTLLPTLFLAVALCACNSKPAASKPESPQPDKHAEGHGDKHPEGHGKHAEGEKPQAGPAKDSRPRPADARAVEAGCGMCMYKMPGVTGCVLAVKIDGKPHLVTGADHVRAHAAGLCAATKPAEAAGKLEGDKFAATWFELKK